MIKIRTIIQASKWNNPNLVFYLFLLAFTIDSVLNFFSKTPVFVPVSILLLPVIWFISSGDKRFFPFAVIISFFILTAIAHNLIFGFHKKNISDLLFILLFVTSYHYYHINRKSLNKSTIYIFITVVLLLFGFTFFNINSNIWRDNHPLYEQILLEKEALIKKEAVDSSQIHYQPVQAVLNDSVTNKSGKVDTANQQTGLAKTDQQIDKAAPDAQIPDLFDEQKPVDFLEIFRNYHNGLFRLPHIAACFFGFLFLFFAFQFQKSKRWFFLLIAALMLLMLLYTGVRSVLVGLAISMMLFYIRKVRLSIIIAAFVLVAVAVLMRHPLYQFFQHTFLGQYFGMIITLVENFSGFSRLLMWKSWYYEMINFSFADYFTGKGFISSLRANVRNIYFKEWFHSDPLSIVYSYGIAGLAAFGYLIYKIYIDNKMAIRQNLFVFSFFWTMVILSIINGFYYFFPVFLLFIFVVMVTEQTATPQEKITQQTST